MARIGAARGGASKPAPQRKPARNPFAAPFSNPLRVLKTPVRTSAPQRRPAETSAPVFKSPLRSRQASSSEGKIRVAQGRRNDRVLSAYDQLPFPNKRAVIGDALRRPDAELSRLLLGHVGGRGEAQKMLLSDDLGKGVVAGGASSALKALYGAGKNAVNIELHARPLQSRAASVGGIPLASTNTSSLTKATGVATGAVLGTGEALVRNPTVNGKSLRVKTLEDLATLPEAIIGGAGQLVYDTGKGIAEGHPLRGPAKTAGAMKNDFATRYGPLTRGDYAGFEKGIEARGSATPELVDLATAVSVGGATAGRALGGLARGGKLGSRLEKVATAPRPVLRVSGGVTKHQDVSKNLFRVAGQRVEDVRRARAHERYAKKATEKGMGVEGLVPNKGEVVPLRSPIPGLGRVINNQRRLGNKEQGRVSSEATSRMDAGKKLITRTVREAKSKLSAPEQVAMPFTVQGLLPVLEDGSYDIARSVKVLESYRKTIAEERNVAEVEAKRIEDLGGKKAGSATVGVAKSAIKKLRDRVDVLQAVDKILADPEAHLTPNLASVSQGIMDKLGPIDASVNEGTAFRRKARPQAEISLPALKPTLEEVNRDLPDRMQPYERPMTAMEIFDTLKPREVPNVIRRAGKDVVSGTRLESAAEVFARAKTVRDTTRPAKEDVRPETPKERLARATRSRDIRYGADPVDKAVEIRTEIDRLRAEKPVKTDNAKAHAEAVKAVRQAELELEKVRGEVKRTSVGEPNYRREPNARDREAVAKGNLARAKQREADLREFKNETTQAARDEKIKALHDDLLENEQKYYQQFADDVAKQAEAYGLPINPVYFRHQKLSVERSGVYTTGAAIRYFDDLARSNMVLLKLGLYDMTPAAFERGLMATLKRASLLRAITENLETLTLKKVNDKRVPTDLNLSELQHWMASEGLNIDGYYFINPKKALRDDVLGSGDSPFFVDPTELVKGKTSKFVEGVGPDVQSMMRMSPDAVTDTKGWYAIPLEAGGSALEKDARGSSALLRLYDRGVRGLGSALVLATSPAWLMMQRIVDAYGLTAASKFNPVTMARTLAMYPFMWHSLTPQMQEAIKARIGAGYHRRAPKMGKAATDIAGRGAAAQWLFSTWDDLAKSRVGRAGAEVPGVLFTLDNWFTSHAKQMRYVSKVEEMAAKQRYEALRESVGTAHASLDRVMQILKKPDVKQIEDLLQDSKVFDEAAAHIHRAFGDWNNLSGAERHGLARLPMFYTWLRFAGRTLFHTLPVRHPVLLSVMLELAKAHKDAMDEYYRKQGALLPGESLPSFSYSKVLREGGKTTDVGRISPVTALPLDLAQSFVSILTGSEIGRGPKALLTALPPVLTAGLETVLGEQLLTGAKLHIGSDPKNNDPYKAGGLPTVAKTYAARVLQSNPVFAALLIMLSGGKPISDDSVPGSVTKLQYSNASGQAGAEAKLSAKGSPTDRALQRTFLPLKAMPDTIPTMLAVQRSKSGSAKPKSLKDEFTQFKNQSMGGGGVKDEYRNWVTSSKSSSVADEYKKWLQGK